MKYILISLFLMSSIIFASNKTAIYNQKDALRVTSLDNSIIFTGLKNKGLYKSENGQKLEIIPSSKTIMNFYKNNGELNIKTNDGHYLYNGKTLNKVDNNKLIVKQMEKKIFILKNNSWLRISPNTKDMFHTPRQKDNLILFSGLNTGLLIYNINTKVTNFISKGVDASFSADGKKVVFAKVSDNGETYTDSEVFIYDIKTKKIDKVLKKDGKVKRFPHLIGDNLFINIDFNIYKMNLNK